MYGIRGGEKTSIALTRCERTFKWATHNSLHVDLVFYGDRKHIISRLFPPKCRRCLDFTFDTSVRDSERADDILQTSLSNSMITSFGEFYEQCACVTFCCLSIQGEQNTVSFQISHFNLRLPFIRIWFTSARSVSRIL